MAPYENKMSSFFIYKKKETDESYSSRVELLHGSFRLDVLERSSEIKRQSPHQVHSVARRDGFRLPSRHWLLFNWTTVNGRHPDAAPSPFKVTSQRFLAFLCAGPPLADETIDK